MLRIWLPDFSTGPFATLRSCNSMSTFPDQPGLQLHEPCTHWPWKQLPAMHASICSARAAADSSNLSVSPKAAQVERQPRPAQRVAHLRALRAPVAPVLPARHAPCAAMARRGADVSARGGIHLSNICYDDSVVY
eukprot:6186277-Pleurochrysis_carterae.AAC.4